MRAKPLHILCATGLLSIFFISQCALRLEYGQCMFRYVLPRCDYASYIRASLEISRGQTPYYEHTDYIYTPLLAILMTPLSWFGEVTGFAIWTVVSVIAFGYGAYRSGSS